MGFGKNSQTHLRDTMSGQNKTQARERPSRKRPRSTAEQSEAHTRSDGPESTLDDDDEDHNNNAICLQFPQHLYHTISYTQVDVTIRQNAQAFFARHRDTPAYFRDARTSLFSAEQRRQLDTLFPVGWQTDTRSPLHALVGSCRASSSHRTQAYDEYAVREASVATFFRKANRGQQLVVSDIDLSKLEAASSLVQGPALFQHANMLQQVPTVTSAAVAVAASTPSSERNHLLCFAILGTRGSYTAPHRDFYGADAYLYLVTGEKLWIYAPPEKAKEFNAMFKQPCKAATIRFSKAEKLYMQQHQIRVIHQRADEVVFLNGGWPHMVKNLTDTVAFGNSYVRPWKFGAFLSFVRQEGLTRASRLVNVTEVVHQWFDKGRQREWGIAAGEDEAIVRKWGAWIKSHVGLGPHQINR